MRHATISHGEWYLFGQMILAGWFEDVWPQPKEQP